MYRILAALSLILLLGPSMAWAQPSTISYQGTLKKGTGAVKTAFDGTALFKFAILCDFSLAEVIVWNSDAASPQNGDPQTTVAIDVESGVFSVLLGDPDLGMPPLTAAELGGCRSPELLVWVDTGDGLEQLPDQPLSSSAFAIWSETASSVPGGGSDTDWVESGDTVYRLTGNVGILTDAPNDALDVHGTVGMDVLEIPASVGSPSLALSRQDGASPGFVFHIGGAGYGAYPLQLGRLDGTNDIWVPGALGIGVSNPTAPLDIAGTGRMRVLEITGGADIAEPFAMVDASTPVLPGSVLVMDVENPGKLRLSESPYDYRVAGVVSGANGINTGMTLQQDDVFDHGENVALTGRVYALASAANGSIEPGDLLTTSGLAGHAMKASDRERSAGAVLGKAMSRLESGEGYVLVLVSLQ